MTIREVAAELGIHPNTAYKLAQNGSLPHHKLGRKVYVSRPDLDTFLADRRHVPLIHPDESGIIAQGENQLRQGKVKSIPIGCGTVYVKRTKSGVKRYYADYYKDGKRHQHVIKQARNLEEACQFMRGVVWADQKTCPFDQWFDQYLADYAIVKKSYEADECRGHIVKEWFGAKPLRDITPMDVERFRVHLIKTKRSKATCNRYVALLKRVFNLGINEGYMNTNPARHVKMFSEREYVKERILTPEEERRLLAVSPPWLRAIILVALNTGMRRGEILGLKWKSVDMKSRLITVEYTKAGRIRLIPMNDTTYNVIKERRNETGEFVFGGRKDIRGSWKTACRKAEISCLRLHDLRHTFASALILSGAEVEATRKLLGHSSISVTGRYLHSGMDSLKASVQKLESLNNGDIESHGEIQNNESFPVSGTRTIH